MKHVQAFSIMKIMKIDQQNIWKMENKECN